MELAAGAAGDIRPAAGARTRRRRRLLDALERTGRQRNVRACASILTRRLPTRHLYETAGSALRRHSSVFSKQEINNPTAAAQPNPREVGQRQPRRRRRQIATDNGEITAVAVLDQMTTAPTTAMATEPMMAVFRWGLE